MGEARAVRLAGRMTFDWKVTVEALEVSSMASISMSQRQSSIERTSMRPVCRRSLICSSYVTQQPNLTPESCLGDGTQFADLRGLGFDTTLVLINGRRTMRDREQLWLSMPST